MCCLYDQGYYELYVDKVLRSTHRTLTEAKREGTRLRKLALRPRRLQVAINYKSICTWGSGSDICKYWKSCVETKGTTFTQPWGKKMLILLEMKRQAKQPTPEPKKDEELNQFRTIL